MQTLLHEEDIKILRPIKNLNKLGGSAISLKKSHLRKSGAKKGRRSLIEDAAEINPNDITI